VDRSFNFKFGDTPHGLAENFRFETKLVFIARMLIVAATALSEVRARRSCAESGGPQQAIELRARKSRMLFYDVSFDALAGKNIRNKHCFGTLAGIGMTQSRQSISAIDELFYREFHVFTYRRG